MQKYITYKDSIKKIVSSIPNHWKSHRAKDVFDSIDVRSAAGHETLLSVSEHRGVVPRNEMKITMFMAESYEGYKLCEEGDIVINSLWAWGRGIGVSEYSGIVSTAYGVFRPRNENQFNPSYLNYLLRTKDYVGLYFMRSKGIWISRLQLQDKNFLDLPIICPPKEEQDEIVQHIKAQEEKINQFIQKKRRFIDLLKEQRQSIITKAITKGITKNVTYKDSGIEWLGEIPLHWNLIKLKFIGESIIGLTYSPLEMVDEDDGILVMRSSNIQNGKFTLDDNVFVNKEIPEKLITRKGDILLCSRNGSASLIGKNILIDEESEGKTFGAFMTIFRSPLFNYLYQFFNSNIFKSQTALFATSTINQLTNDILSNLKVAYPESIEEQNQIIEYIKIETANIDTAIAKAEREIELIKEYKEAMIAEAVMGKIKLN